MIQTVIKDQLIELFESVDDGKEVEEQIFDKEGDKFLNINYEFQSFEKTVRVNYGYWFTLHFLPAPSVQKELGHCGMNEWTGLFQIDVCVYKTNTNIQEIFDTTYAAIAEVMKRGVYYKNVKIRKIYNSSAVDNDDYYTMPITVEWWANLAN